LSLLFLRRRQFSRHCRYTIHYLCESVVVCGLSPLITRLWTDEKCTDNLSTRQSSLYRESPGTYQPGGAEPKMYCYQPLQKPTSICLLKLLPGKQSHTLACDLVESDLSVALNYEAISYCWAMRAAPKKSFATAPGCRRRKISRSRYAAFEVRRPKPSFEPMAYASTSKILLSATIKFLSWATSTEERVLSSSGWATTNSKTAQ
jgi:hypothetical protein